MSEDRVGAANSRAADMLNAFLARNQAGGSEPRSILDEATVELFDAFAEAGVDALLLKGAGLARLLYQPAENRTYIDIDVLADPRDLGRAAHVLDRLGYENMSARVAIDDIGEVVHEETWLGGARLATSPIQVELHRWLPGVTAAPEIAWEAISEHRTNVELDNGRVPTLGREGQALQLAMHAAQHGHRYTKGIQELSLALERWPVEIWKGAAALASEVGATEAFGAGLRLTGRGTELAATLDLPAGDELDWEVRHLDERPRGVFHLDAFRRASGLKSRAALLRRALLPAPRWLARDYRWAERGPVRLMLAYGLHMLRAPLWVARAWWFRRRGGRRNR